MKTNKARVPDPVLTAPGAQAFHINSLAALRRSILACLLWEKNAYCDGESVAIRIAKLVRECRPPDVAALAIEAREEQNLRHIPLLLLRELAAHPKLKDYPQLLSKTLARVIQRADELAEFVALYWKDGKKMLPKQVRRGLAWAFHKFDAYQFGKYKGGNDKAVRLRDVMFLTYPIPRNPAEVALFKQIADDTLPVPDTWEVQLSAGADKGETFTRLLTEKRIGYFALLKNLRNMQQAGVDEALIKKAILARKGGADRVLPFRFLAAAKAAPAFEEELDEALLANLAEAPKLPGKTLIVVDISGSMAAALSGKSDMNRMMAAASLAAILRETCENPRIYATAGNDGSRVHATAEVPARRGMALVDAVMTERYRLGNGGIFLTPVLRFLQEREKDVDRIIVVTDEQDCAIAAADRPTLARPFGTHNYLINVSVEKNGIGYRNWTHIDGFSESVVRFILANEQPLQGPIPNGFAGIPA